MGLGAPDARAGGAPREKIEPDHGDLVRAAAGNRQAVRPHEHRAAGHEQAERHRGGAAEVSSRNRSEHGSIPTDQQAENFTVIGIIRKILSAKHRDEPDVWSRRRADRPRARDLKLGKRLRARGRSLC